MDQLHEGKEDFRAEISSVSNDVVVTNLTRSTTISILDAHGKHNSGNNAIRYAKQSALVLFASLCLYLLPGAKFVNDSVIADPLFTAPVGNGDAHFCYEIRGKPNTTFNLVSDKCTVVNAEYVSMNIPQNGNVVGAVGIRAADSAGNCHNIEVRLSPPGSRFVLDASIDGEAVTGVVRVDSVSVRRYLNRVRVAVPNCELVDLVMWVTVVEMRGQNMINFIIMRGINLTPTSHGLVGETNFSAILRNT